MKSGSLVSVLIAIVLFQAGVSLTTSRLLTRSEASSDLSPPETLRFRLDSSKSKFIAHALPGGLLWFKGHEHLVGVREFSGEAQLTTDSIKPASLQITAKTESMVETSDKFTDAQKQIINKELREIVLEPAKYPEIVFKSTEVNGKATATGQYDLKVSGDLSLHGVTRQVSIPTRVSITGNDLRAQGEFSINRSDYKVKATSAVHGLVRVRGKVKFTFDIVGTRIEYVVRGQGVGGQGPELLFCVHSSYP